MENFIVITLSYWVQQPISAGITSRALRFDCSIRVAISPDIFRLSFKEKNNLLSRARFMSRGYLLSFLLQDHEQHIVPMIYFRHRNPSPDSVFYGNQKALGFLQGGSPGITLNVMPLRSLFWICC